MDFYAYVWGVVKYLMPAMILIIAVWIDPNALLMLIAVIWISSSVIVSVLGSDMDNKQKGRNF